jgi:hypothetical protein
MAIAEVPSSEGCPEGGVGQIGDYQQFSSKGKLAHYRD